MTSMLLQTRWAVQSHQSQSGDVKSFAFLPCTP